MVRLAVVVVGAVACASAVGWVRGRAAEARLWRRLAAHRPFPGPPRSPWWEEASQRLAPCARWLERIVASAMSRIPRRERLGLVVEQSNVGITPIEVVAVGVVAGVASMVALLAMGLPVLVAVAFAAGAAVVPAGAVTVVAGRRRAAFAAELPDVLLLLAGTLRAGVPLSAAIEAAAGEAGGPVAPELRRVAGETALGRPLPEALASLGERMRSEEVAWVGMAVEIHQQAGGNFAEVLDTVARTVSERRRLRREVAALTAEGRISAVVLGILPIGLAGVIAVVNPGYLASLLETRAGTMLVVGACIGMVVGFLWMRRIVDVEG